MNSPTYQISADGRSITCALCEMTSYHADDVAHRYCGWCHIFHDDLPLLPDAKREQLVADLKARRPLRRGIHAAERALQHGQISTTKLFYLSAP